MAEYIMSPCTVADVDAMVDVYIAAYRGSYMNDIIFPPAGTDPGHAIIRAWLGTRFAKFLTQGHAEMHSTKVTEVATGRLAAWARWGYPHVLTDEEKARRATEKAADEEKKVKDGEPPFPKGSNIQAATEYFAAMDVMREKHMKTEEDYLLYFLATDPAHGRRGLGAMLLNEGIALADAQQRRIYLEATNMGHPLYTRMGWRDVDVINIDLTRWGLPRPAFNSVMMRDPKGKL